MLFRSSWMAVHRSSMLPILLVTLASPPGPAPAAAAAATITPPPAPAPASGPASADLL